MAVHRTSEKYTACLPCKSVRLGTFFRMHADQKGPQKGLCRREEKVMQPLFGEDLLDHPDSCSDLTDKECLVERNRFRGFIGSGPGLFGYRL